MQILQVVGIPETVMYLPRAIFIKQAAYLCHQINDEQPFASLHNLFLCIWEYGFQRSSYVVARPEGYRVVSCLINCFICVCSCLNRCRAEAYFGKNREAFSFNLEAIIPELWGCLWLFNGEGKTFYTFTGYFLLFVVVATLQVLSLALKTTRRPEAELWAFL